MYVTFIKKNWKMSTCNWLDLETPLGSRPIMPKNIPGHQPMGSPSCVFSSMHGLMGLYYRNLQSLHWSRTPTSYKIKALLRGRCCQLREGLGVEWVTQNTLILCGRSNMSVASCLIACSHSLVWATSKRFLSVGVTFSSNLVIVMAIGCDDCW